MGNRQFLKTEELAARLNCPRSWIYRLASQGMPKIQVGKGNFRFIEEDCRAWLISVQQSMEKNDASS
ncbi:hypothetical protein M3223_04240 [Paenibacillus pasadenensis]|uniref:helix-turn-helix transcriptional regulator n=1 Tax=Paenibacillus pasadenensis TaxID=217090 RepID=UPI002041B33B|nr:helix-turn-helix domain-containing protein [Paenibacillus pasadenensis]MCM3746559.1 hypothetical protein [Paenibacillus pasadenensis]